MFFVGQWQLNAMLTCFATPVSRMSSCLIVEFSPSPASSSKNIVKNVTIIQGCTLHFGWIYGGWRDLTGRENENTKSMGNHKNITTSAAYLRQSRKEKTMLFQKIPPEIHAFWRVQASLTRFTISPPFSVSSLQLRSILVTVVLHKCGVKIVKLVALKWGYPYSWHVG